MIQHVVEKLSRDIETIYKLGLVYADVRLENIVFSMAVRRRRSLTLTTWCCGKRRVMRNRLMYDNKTKLSLREADLTVLRELGNRVCCRLSYCTCV